QGEANAASVEVRQPDAGRGQQHLHVELGNVFEDLQVNAFGVYVFTVGMIGTEFQDHHQSLVAGHLRLFEAVAAPQPAACSRQQDIAAGKNGQVLEGAEIHADVNAPIACFFQALLDVFTAEMHEIGSVHEPRKVPIEAVEPVQLFFGAQAQERLHVRVRI